MVSEQIAFIFNWASWSSIFAGAVTALAISVIMAVLGVALGFTVLSPKSDDPTAGLGVAFGIWSFLSVVVSMAGGGFIAGIFSANRGIEHGFLVWALVTLAATLFGGLAVGAAVKTIGNVMRGVGRTAAEAAAGIGKGTLDAASAAISELKENVNLDVSMEKIGNDTASVLRDTGIETLQPDYLKSQLREARSDLRGAVHQMALKPSDAENIINRLIRTEKERLDSFTGSINRDDAVNALIKTRNLPRGEAETLVDNALEAYDQAAQKVRDCLFEAKAQIRDAGSYLKELSDQAREKADQMAANAAKTAMAAAAALFVAAVVSMGAGYFGMMQTGDIYTAYSALMLP